jgi:hypothetical protein
MPPTPTWRTTKRAADAEDRAARGLAAAAAAAADRAARGLAGAGGRLPASALSPARTMDLAVLITCSSDPRRGFHHSAAQFRAPSTSSRAARGSSSARSAPWRLASSNSRRQTSPYLLAATAERTRMFSGIWPALRMAAVVWSEISSAYRRCASTAASIRSSAVASAGSASSWRCTCSVMRAMPDQMTSSMRSSRDGK